MLFPSALSVVILCYGKQDRIPLAGRIWLIFLIHTIERGVLGNGIGSSENGDTSENGDLNRSNMVDALATNVTIFFNSTYSREIEVGAKLTQFVMNIMSFYKNQLHSYVPSLFSKYC